MGGTPCSADICDVGGMDIDRFDDFLTSDALGDFGQFRSKDVISGNPRLDGSERNHLNPDSPDELPI
jgi:hypothetical protein